MGKLNNTTRYPVKTPVDADQIYGYSSAAAGPGSIYTFSGLLTWLRSKLAAAPVTLAEGGTGATNAAAARDALAAAPAAFGVLSSTGLTLNLAAGYILDANGVKIAHGALSCTLRASQTQYVVWNPWQNALYSLKRHIGTADVLVATITTGASSVTELLPANPIRLNASRISRFLGAMNRSTAQKRIVLIGDSLTAGTGGGGTLWRTSLFDSAQSARGYNIPNVATTTTVSYAIGGMSARWGVALLANCVSPGQATNVGYTFNGYARDQSQAAYLPDVVAGLTPLGGNNPRADLAIVMLGANGMSYNSGMVENCIKQLRELGIEVVIATSNPTVSNPASLETAGPTMRLIADTWDCELVDSWAYFSALTAAGGSLYADDIHPNQTGSDVYAVAFRGVLHGYNAEACASNGLPSLRVVRAEDATYNNRFPSEADIMFVPTTTTGASIAATTAVGQSSTLNPAIATGARTSGNCVTELTVGELAVFSHPHFHFFDLLVETDSSFVVTIDTQAGQTLRTGVAHTTNGNGLVVVEGARYAEIDAWTGFPSSAMGAAFDRTKVGHNSGVRITTTSGTCKLVGIIFYRYKRTSIPLENLRTVGTWGTESAGTGAILQLWTDTTASYVIADGVGDGMQMLAVARAASGIIDTKLDGTIVNNDLDFYVAGNYFFPFNVGPLTYGQHSISLYYTGSNNVSASGTSAANRRLAVVAAWSFDGR